MACMPAGRHLVSVHLNFRVVGDHGEMESAMRRAGVPNASELLDAGSGGMPRE